MKPETFLVELRANLEAIAQISGQGAIYHDLYSRDILLNARVCAFCRHAVTHPVTAPLCRFSCCNAITHAMASGEPYFYRCWAGLLFATVPVAPQNKCCGGITLGGFHAEDEAGEIAETVGRHLQAWPTPDVNTFLARLRTLRPITPSALRGLGALAMETTFSSGINSSSFFRTQNERYLQQRRIAEAFEDLRRQPASPPDLLGDTYQLVSFLHRNDKARALEFMSRYLARLLMASNWDLTKLKAHIRVLLAIMTSQDILRGTPWAVATSRELRHMLRLEKALTTEESCYQAAEWIQSFFGAQERENHDGRSLSERSLAWLQAHYQDHVTLETAATAIGASSSTLVHRLRRETGKTFKQLLAEIRIAEAKKLMASTSLEISAIAEHCGFYDQSHFTRELKRAINLTPGEFRKLLRVPDEALRRPGTPSPDTPPSAPSPPSKPGPRQPSHRKQPAQRTAVTRTRRRP